MKEEYIKLFELLKNKTGFSSEPMKEMASKEIMIAFMKWSDNIIHNNKKDFTDLTDNIENHIEFIKSLN